MRSAEARTIPQERQVSQRHPYDMHCLCQGAGVPLRERLGCAERTMPVHGCCSRQPELWTGRKRVWHGAEAVRSIPRRERWAQLPGGPRYVTLLPARVWPKSTGRRCLIPSSFWHTEGPGGPCRATGVSEEIRQQGQLRASQWCMLRRGRARLQTPGGDVEMLADAWILTAGRQGWQRWTSRESTMARGFQVTGERGEGGSGAGSWR